MKIILTFFCAIVLVSCSKVQFMPDLKLAKLHKDKSYLCNNPQAGNIYSLPTTGCEQQSPYMPVVMPQAHMPVNPMQNQMPNMIQPQMPANQIQNYR